MTATAVYYCVTKIHVITPDNNYQQHTHTDRHSDTGLTLSTRAWDACCSVLSTTSMYFLNSGPRASAMSPNTDRIWGFTDRWTCSF